MRRSIIAQRKAAFRFNVEDVYKMWLEGKNLTQIKQFYHLDASNTSIRQVLKEFYGITDEKIQERGKQTRGNGGHGKPLLQLDLKGNLIKEWPNAVEPAKALNISRQAISMNARGKTKTCKNYIWRFKDDK